MKEVLSSVERGEIGFEARIQKVLTPHGHGVLVLKRGAGETTDTMHEHIMTSEDNAHDIEMDVPSSPFDEVCILAEVASSLSSSYELPQILQVILTGATASQGVGFNRCFLFLYDEKESTLHGHMAVGPSSTEEAEQIWQQLSTQQISFGELLAQQQYRTNQQVDPITQRIAGMSIQLTSNSLIQMICAEHTSVKIDSLEQLDSLTHALLTALNTEHAALIPMTANGKLMGLLIADNAITKREISDRDVRLLHMLANQAAVAMERARLYESQKERVDELYLMNQLLADSQEQLVATEKMSFVGELTAAVASELKHPISVIEGFASILGQTAMSDDQREYLRILHQETQRLESVVSRLAEFCALSRLPYRTFDLNELIAELVAEGIARDRRLETMITPKFASEQIVVDGNRAQLRMGIEQMIKLIIDELPPPTKIELRTETTRQIGSLYMTLTYPEQTALTCSRSLQTLLAGHGSSVSLPALFVSETIRFHGGTIGCDILPNTMVMIYFSLPLSQSVQAGSVNEVFAE